MSPDCVKKGKELEWAVSLSSTVHTRVDNFTVVTNGICFPRSSVILGEILIQLVLPLMETKIDAMRV